MTAMGTSCRFSERFCAVMMISSSPGVAVADGLVASSAWLGLAAIRAAKADDTAKATQWFRLPGLLGLIIVMCPSNPLRIEGTRRAWRSPSLGRQSILRRRHGRIRCCIPVTATQTLGFGREQVE